MHELTKKTEVEKNQIEKEKIIYIGCDFVFATQKCNQHTILSTNVMQCALKIRLNVCPKKNKDFLIRTGSPLFIALIHGVQVR